MQTFFRAAVGSCTFDAVPTPEGDIVLVWTDPKNHNGPDENEVSVAEAREMIAALEAAVHAVDYGSVKIADLAAAAVAAAREPKPEITRIRSCWRCRSELRFHKGQSQSETGGKLFGFCRNCGGKNEITAAEQNEIHSSTTIAKEFSPVGPPLP